MSEGANPSELNLGGRGVVTLALVASARQTPSPLQAPFHPTVQVFAKPSDAIEATVRRVAEAKGGALAAITTTEIQDEPAVTARLRQMIGAVAEGAVVVSLATVELARSGLDEQYGFTDLGTFEMADGGRERLFLVDHATLTNEGGPEPAGFHPNTFLGRTAELEEIVKGLDRSRLVSIVGPSGIGKTALIQRYLSEHEDTFSDGIIHVDLSGVNQAAVVVPTLLRLSGSARLPGESALEAFLSQVRLRHSLVVIDNYEGVASEVRRVVSSLLKTAPNVAILTGGQRPLRVATELRIKISGLSVPSEFEDWRAIAQYEAVSLFAERAHLVDSQFRITPTNAATVARLCQRLDGIPLAIEMAASKLVVLSPKQILDRLDRRFEFLATEEAGRPDRHRTLKATIDWGHEQLRPESRTLLRRLAVFRGAFSLEDATAVAADGRLLTSDAVYGAFEELSEASMMLPSTVDSSEKRFYLSETVRIYAQQKLKQASEERAIAERHRAWAVDLATNAAKGLTGPAQLEWLDRLDAGYEDLCRLIEHESAPGGDMDLAMEVLAAIGTYYLHRTYLAEGLRLCQRITKSPKARNRPLFARLLNLAAAFSMRLGDFPSARRYALRALRVATKRKDAWIVAAARNTLAGSAQELGRPFRAHRHYLAAIRIFRLLGDEHRLLNILINTLGIEVELNLPGTEERIADAERLLTRHPNPVLRAYLNQNRAHYALIRGDYDQSLRWSAEATTFFEGSRDHQAVQTCLRNAAYALHQKGDGCRSAYFAGAHNALSEQEGSVAGQTVQKRWNAFLNVLRQELGNEYSTWWSAGHKAPIEELIGLMRANTSI